MPQELSIDADHLGECCGLWTYRTIHLQVRRNWTTRLTEDAMPTEARDRALEVEAEYRDQGAARMPYDAYWEELDEDGYEIDDYPSDDEYVDGYVRNYSYRPQLNFRGEGPVFLGAEIEIEAEDASLSTGAALVHDRAGEGSALNLMYMKEDGSISYGFEVVTHPMSYAWAAENFPGSVFEDLYALGFRARPSCGIHVHVSRAGFSNAQHVYRWLAFFYRNPEPIQRLARRGSVDYCSWSDSPRTGFVGAAKGNRRGQRYVPINVQNSETFEVRIFRSSLRPQAILAALGLVDASVEYTRQLTVQQIARSDGWSFAAFRRWVIEQGRWDALVAEMDERIPPPVAAHSESKRTRRNDHYPYLVTDPGERRRVIAQRNLTREQGCQWTDGDGFCLEHSEWWHAHTTPEEREHRAERRRQRQEEIQEELRRAEQIYSWLTESPVIVNDGARSARTI